MMFLILTSCLLSGPRNLACLNPVDNYATLQALTRICGYISAAASLANIELIPGVNDLNLIRFYYILSLVM
jgi:hypothetical protein